MSVHLRFYMNEKLFLKDPEQSELGRKIISRSIQLIHQNGFEDFTFRKLAKEISSTEASIYRYFENKHRLLTYLTAWYWNWLEYQVSFQTNNIKDATEKLKVVIELLTKTVENDDSTLHVDEKLLHQIVITEGAKTFLTQHVSEDNADKLFKPYKDLCAMIAAIVLEAKSDYIYPKSLASTIIEMAHFQSFFMKNLPALTDFGDNPVDEEVRSFIENLVFSSLGQNS